MPGERLVMRTQGPFPMETTYTWGPPGRRTRITLRNRGKPAGFSTSGFVDGPGDAPANRKDLAKLKTILESR